jgi:MFS family permease
MLHGYRAVFRAPGSAAFCLAGFVMRAPIAIYPLALVLVISSRSGHFGFAGVLTGTYVGGSIPGTLAFARALDRYGQTAMIAPATAVHVGAMVTTGGLAQSGAPRWTLLAPVFLGGFCYLPVGSMMRARWSNAVGDRAGLHTAYALESTLDELIFVCGPVVAVTVATLVSPVLTLYLSALLVAVGAVWLGLLRETAPPPREHGTPSHPIALRLPGLSWVMLTAFGMGMTFATAQVAILAFCTQRGHAGEGGVVLALAAAGSGVSGFVYGSRHRTLPVALRFRRQALAFAVAPILYFAGWDIPALAVCACVVGMTVAPTLISAIGVIEAISPPGALTEGIAWVLTGLNIGWAVGSAVVGSFADAHGARVSFTLSLGASVLAGIAACASYPRLRSA